MPQIFDLELIQNRLERARPWTAYALADLDPDHLDYASWFCAKDGSGLALLYREFARPILFVIEPSEQPASLFGEMRPAPVSGLQGHSQECEIAVGLEAISVIRSLFQVREERRMLRMILDSGCFRPEFRTGVMRIGPDHLQAVHNLYGSEPPEFFLDSMLVKGVYFGIYENADLIAIAGTHIISPAFGVAGLGNIYTRPDRRGRRYCKTVTSAVTGELLRIGISTVVLNVREENAAAIRAYNRIGFKEYCRYYEIVASISNPGTFEI